MAPWVSCSIVRYLTDTLLRKGLEHHTEHGISLVLLIHISPLVEVGTHSWNIVLLHICTVEILDRESGPSFWRTEYVI
jgi:hypothetical protein